jgi:carbamoyltransferase
MLICGVKVTHDAAVAVIDGVRLLFSIELEKLDNRPRFTPMPDISEIDRILKREGLSTKDIDLYVLDGWHSFGRDRALIPTHARNVPTELQAAPYLDDMKGAAMLRREFSAPFRSGHRSYASYSHAAGHLAASYCSGPFPSEGLDSYVLVWDGGMTPRLFTVSGESLVVRLLGMPFPLIGQIFTHFCMQFPPFVVHRSGEEVVDLLPRRGQYSVPGKAMAYAALGTVEPDTFPAFRTLMSGMDTTSSVATSQLGSILNRRRAELFPGLTDADLVASFQAYLGEILLKSVVAMLSPDPSGAPRNLCLAGGCALNIKWNSRLRDSGRFNIWVPPFPNDSGAAIGTACCEMMRRYGNAKLEWDVRLGPALTPSDPAPGWVPRPCDEAGVARLLHETGEPIVVLDGRAELGPRALGSRSIIAPAITGAMKDRLNELKRRESYRPVAPVCLEHRAPEFFMPGVRDPYMLFEHHVRPSVSGVIPAVVHLDGSARLQTVSAAEDSVIARILAQYERISGIPVLCNTSANLPGCGFFADVRSATEWSGTCYVWSDGQLYEKVAKATAGAVPSGRHRKKS